MKKKVAFVVTALNSGGIENYLLRFLIYQKDEIDATVYCRANFIGELSEEYENALINVIPFKLGYFNILDYVRFSTELKIQKFDTIVDFCGNLAGLTLTSAKFSSVDKRLVFYRNSSDRFKRDFLRNLYDDFMKVLVRANSTAILANSNAGLEFYHPKYWRNNNKYQVIYNGIDASSFLSDDRNIRNELDIPMDAYVIGHIGRFNEAKNHDTIIKVAEQLCNQHDNIYFILCGANVDVKLGAIVEKLGLKKQIKLLGYRKDIIRVLNSLDCFYFPSTTEGQPNALIEAMIAGLPFVASDIIPIKETVPSEYHRQLVPPNSVTEAVQKLEQLYRKEIDFTLKEWAENYFRPDFWFNMFLKQL